MKIGVWRAKGCRKDRSVRWRRGLPRRPRECFWRLPHINEHVARWAMHKFKRFRGKYAKAMARLQKVHQHQPRLFAHWQLIAFTAGRTAGAG